MGTRNKRRRFGRTGRPGYRVGVVEKSPIDISYLIQRTRIPGDPDDAPEWINISEPDQRRGAVHKGAKNARSEANKQRLTGVKIRVLKIVVTVDKEGF